MPCVLGIDLSTRAIDFAYVDENSDAATWSRCLLDGPDAWARTLEIGELRHDTLTFEDVYLVAIEAPYSRAKGKSLLMLNRVVGAIAASLPKQLRTPERCWLVAPHEWKQGLGLRAKPTADDVTRLLRPLHVWESIPDDQNARDAACLALWARNENARGIEEAITAA